MQKTGHPASKCTEDNNTRINNKDDASINANIPPNAGYKRLAPEPLADTLETKSEAEETQREECNSALSTEETLQTNNLTTTEKTKKKTKKQNRSESPGASMTTEIS